MHLISVKILGIVVLVIGIAIRYVIHRNRFNRRNVAGLQQYSSYERAWTTQFIERIGKLVAWLMILGGLLLIFIAL